MKNFLKNVKQDLEFFYSKNYWSLFIDYTDQTIDRQNEQYFALPRKGFLLRIAIFYFSYFRSLKKKILCKFIHQGGNDSKTYNTLVYVPQGGSERSALNFIIEDNKRPLKDKKIIGTYVPFLVFFVANLYLPLLIYRYFFQNSEHKELYPLILDQMALVMGWRFYQNMLMEHRKFQFFIYSNHVSPIARSLLFVIRQSKYVKIIYIEHTVMLPYWPPVDADYFLLSGRLSLEFMQKNTRIKKGQVHLVGSPKNDNINLEQQNAVFDSIGICISTIDNLSKVSGIIKYFLQNHENFSTINVRPHPEFRNFHKIFDECHEKIRISLPKSQTLKNFLMSNDIIVVGNSGVLFEAIQADKNIIRFKFDDRPTDIYPLPNIFPHILKNLDEVDNVLSSNEKYSLMLSPKQKNYIFDNYKNASFESSTKLTYEALQKIYYSVGF